MNHLFKLALFLPFILFTTAPVIACTCVPIEDFCSSIFDSNYILLGVVGEEIDELKISIDVLEQIHRDVPYDKIELFGGGGYEAACIEGFYDLNLGDTLVLSLALGRDWLVGSPMEDQMTDSTFVRSLCGIHKLEYSNGEVYGPVRPDVSSFDYQAFVAEIELCIDFPSNTPGGSADEPEFYLSPNPATGSFRVEVADATIDVVEVFTVAGQKMPAPQSADLRTRVVATDRLASGVYLVRVVFSDQRIGVRKLVVAR